MRIELPTGTTAELARPADGRTPVRGVVLFPDIGGLRPLFDDLAQHLADTHGWAVCSPEPWPGREDLTLEDRLASVHTLDDTEVLTDVLAAADATEADSVAMIGFCMGGMYGFKAAALGRFDRIAAFYGMIRLPDAWKSDGQGEPLDALAAGDAASVLAIIGTADIWTPASDVDDLEATGATVVRYLDGEHGFIHDPSRDTHRAADAADAWSRVADWFA